jgi:LuxR family maltose regulon positive regulatory protein
MQDSTYAWLSLDKYDDDLETFLIYLVAAIRTAYPDSLSDFVPLLKVPAPLAPQRLADSLLQGLAALPGPLILALDDYHAITTPDVHTLTIRLIEHLPEHVHLVLMTRADPPMPLERLRGRNAVGEIRAADLRFSTEETWLLLQQLLGQGITRETAALLEHSTEGWAVGLHLAALSLRSQADRGAFARKIAHYGHQSITEYLLSEVLAGLPTEQRDCLLQSSLFDRFCAPLIDAAQAADGKRLPGDIFMDAIRRANLFVVALDEEGTWFRYHHLFQSLLRVRLSQRLTDAEIKAVHARASNWFGGQGLVDEAVVHALKAGVPSVAAELVEAQVHSTLNREDWRQLDHLLGLLPAEVLGRPRLILAQAWLHFFRWQFGAIGVRLDAAEHAQLDKSTAVGSTETTLRGEISVLRAVVASTQGSGETTMQLAEAALQALRPEMYFAIGLAQFYYIWGMQACGQYERAVDYAHQQLDTVGWQANVLTLRLFLALGSAHFEMANLPAMQGVTTVWHRLVDGKGFGLSLAWSLFSLGWLCYQKNELDRASEYFRRVIAMAWTAHGRAVVDGYTGLVLIALMRGHLDEASVLINALGDHLMERGMPSLIGVVQSLEQRVALAKGSEAALTWRGAIGAAPSSADLWEQPELTEVRTLLAISGPSELAQAAASLAKSRANALARNSNRRLIEIEALKALVSAAQGEEAVALIALQEAVVRAEPGGALRLLVDCGQGLVVLLQKLKDAGTAPGYIQRLLTALGETAVVLAQPAGQPASAGVAGRQPLPAELFTNREIDVLLLLAQRLGDKEIAAQLFLSPLTVKKHTQRLYRKLGVANRRAAVAEARHLGLI